ncbi:hypothetical protein D3C87_1858450 [compost metagenome]
MIQDTGIGLQEDVRLVLNKELEKINDHVHMLVMEEEPTSTQFFALKNVKSRLKLFYGKTADLHIESIPGAGATVTVTIPVGSDYDLHTNGNESEEIG